jgi:hypothetical protein
MEDNSFDKKMKSVLEGYEDTTPSNLGWERFQGKYGQTVGMTGVKRSLKLSAAANVLLVGTVVWLLWNVNLLQDRITTIEKEYPTIKAPEERNNEASKAADEKAVEAVDNAADVAASGSAMNNQRPSIETSANATPQYSPPADAAGADKLVAIAPTEEGGLTVRKASAFSAMPGFRRKGNSTMPGIRPVNTHLAFVKVYGETSEIVPAKTKEADVHLPMQTVVALEKNKMGNKIGWAFGLTGGFGMANFGTGYKGVGIQKGIAVGALIHPFWGIESGISFDQNLVSTRDIYAGIKAWQSMTGAAPSAPIDKVAINLESLEIPLLIRLRLPVSDRKSWFTSLGLVQSFRLSEKETFYVKQLEDHEEYESHYELAKREFSSKGISPFYTGFIGEIGLSRQIKALPLRWQLSAYYKRNVGQVSGNFSQAEMVGIKGALRFSRW